VSSEVYAKWKRIVGIAKEKKKVHIVILDVLLEMEGYPHTSS
jgi:hypothetical protein